MGAFGGLILTNKGRNLQVKAQTGVQLNFTKIKIGDGSLSGQSIVDLTNLINTKKELTILGIERLTGGKAKLRSYFTNTDIVTGFYWRELGVFAWDPDEGEILYCYGNAGANAEYIPAGGGPDVVERYINVITLVGNASNITATLGSEIYVTQADFDNHTGNTVIHVTQTEKDIWNAKETPAGAQAKADVAEGNAKIYTDQQVATRVQNAGNTPSIQAGLDNSKPLPSVEGRLYVATDTQIIYRDTGTAWQKVGVVKWVDIEGKPELVLASDLAVLFDPTTGHKHTGEAGDGPKLTHDAIDTAKISAIMAYQSTAQSISSNTWTKVAFQSEVYDHLGEYDPATYRFTATKAGIYLVSSHIMVDTYAISWMSLGIRVNGSPQAETRVNNNASGTHAGIQACVPLKLNANDYVEIYLALGTADTLLAGPLYTYLSICRIA